MLYRTKLFLQATVTLSLLGGACAAYAETVTTETVVTNQPIPNTNRIDFMAFDVNGDSKLSREEVGDKLFKLFDNDGNEVIDNQEFNMRKVMTIIPLKKEVFTFVDRDSDGNTDETTYSYSEFFQKSGLMRFDNNMDGLSPSEFIKVEFGKLDDNNSKVIELDEWKEAYAHLVKLPVTEPERYNY